MIDSCMGNRPRSTRPTVQVEDEPQVRETIYLSLTAPTPAQGLQKLMAKVQEEEKRDDFFVVSIDHHILPVPNGYFVSLVLIKSTKPLS